MSPKQNLLAIGLTVLGILGLAPTRDDDLPAPPPGPAASAASASPSVILLTDGRMLQGKVIEDGNDWIIRQRGGDIRKRKDQVEGVFRSLTEVYQYRKNQIPELDPDEHLKLARWCLTQNLTESAKVEVQLVLKVSPRSREAKAMLTSIEATEAREAPALIDAGLVRTGGDIDAIDQVSPSVLKAAKVNLGVSDTPVIFNLPPSLAVRRAMEFKSYVHPLLQASCIKCHNENSDRTFRMVEVRNPKHSSGEILRANLDACLQLVDPENPAKSELLAVTLVPHGNRDPKRPVFTGSNDPSFRVISTWVSSLQTKTPALGAAVPLKPNSSRRPSSATGFASESDAVPLPFSQTPSTAPTALSDPAMAKSVDNREIPPARFVPGRGMVTEQGPPAEGEFPVPFAVTGQKPTIAEPGQKPATPSRPTPKLPGGAVPLPKISADALPDLPSSTEVEEPTNPGSTPKQPARKKKPVKIDPKLLEKALQNRNTPRVVPPGQ